MGRDRLRGVHTLENVSGVQVRWYNAYVGSNPILIAQAQWSRNDKQRLLALRHWNQYEWVRETTSKHPKCLL